MNKLLIVAALILSGCVNTVITTAAALPVGYAADVGINCVRGGECGDTISGDTGDAYNNGSDIAKGLCVGYEMTGVSLWWDEVYFDSCSKSLFRTHLGTDIDTHNHCTRTAFYEARRKIRYDDGETEWERMKRLECPND